MKDALDQLVAKFKAYAGERQDTFGGEGFVILSFVFGER